MEALEQIQLRTQLRILEQEHRDLDEVINALEVAGTVDQLLLRRLKKKKLGLKDRIIMVENRLIPDIMA